MKKSYLIISEQSTKKIIRIKEIMFFERISSKVVIHTFTEEISLYTTLNSIEERLEDKNFYRCHRSYLVNLQNVKEVESVGDRVYKVNFIKGNKFAYVSRERYQGFCEMLGEEGIVF